MFYKKMLAIIKTGGKQYSVKEGDKIRVEKIEGKEGDKIKFPEVLLVGDENGVKIGTPVLTDAKVEGKIVAQVRDKKVWGMKYKAKKRYRVKFGHKQMKTEVEIVKVG